MLKLHRRAGTVPISSREHVMQGLIWAIAGRLQHCVDKAHSKQEQRKDESLGPVIKDSTKLSVALTARIELN